MFFTSSKTASIITLLLAGLTVFTGSQASTIAPRVASKYYSKLHTTQSYNEVRSGCSSFINNADIMALFDAVVKAGCFGSECQQTKMCAYNICIQITAIANSGKTTDLQDLTTSVRALYQGSRKIGTYDAGCCDDKGHCMTETPNTIQYVSKIDLIRFENTPVGAQSGQFSVYTYEQGGNSICSDITNLLDAALQFVPNSGSVLGVLSVICSATGDSVPELGLPGVNATLIG